LCSRQESNLHYKHRKLASYPLNDESIAGHSTIISAFFHINAAPLIAHMCAGAHHEGMQGKRHRSRGNVAVAALLFVAFVGVAAVSLDSVRPVDTGSQVAATEAAKTTEGKDEAVTKKCEIGYDYVVRMDDKGVATVKPTLADPGIPAAPKERENQCKPKLADTYLKGRTCDAEWKCDVWMCIPKKFTKDNEDEECRVNGGEALAVGKAVEMPKYKSQMADIIAEHIRESDVKRGAEIFSETKKADSAFSSSIFKSLGGPERAEELNKQLPGADAAAKELRALANNCSDTVSGGFMNNCGQLEADAAAAEQRAKDLRDEAQKLNDGKKVLEAGTPGCSTDATKCPTKDAPPPGTDVPCETNKNQPKCNPNRFPGDPGGSPPPGGGQNPSSSSGGGLGDLMKGLGQFAPLLGQLLNGAMQGSRAPTCDLKASPANITRPGQPVTLTWRSENAQQAYLSASGQVGPTGQTTVYPQQPTTYTMQVTGYPQQQAQQQQQQPQGQFVYNPYTGQYQFVQGQQQQQPQGQGAPQQGQCQVQVTVGQGSGGDNGSGGDKPKAQVSCQPKIADVGMSVSISYACQNATASKGEGFSTGDKLSGSASADVSSPEKGSTTVKYGLSCTKDGATDAAECTINVNKPSIVLVANPKDIEEDEKTTIGWVTGAMESCVVSSPDLPEFTEANKNNTSTSGSAKTPELEDDTRFVLTCTTKAGGTKTAETAVQVD
jgi:hypothetical protein